MRSRFMASVAAVAIAACGSGDTRSLRLVPVAVDGSDCGIPIDGRTMRVVALGDFPASADTGEQIQIERGEVNIAGFPPATRQLTVEVFGNAGARRTIGKTLPFAMEDLDDGDELLVFMTPPNGFCPTNAPAAARAEPLVARAGTGVLIAGGHDGAGVPVTVAELYATDTGRFTDLGDLLYGDSALGLIGAAMVALPDGRVVVVGGAQPAYQLYDPDTATAEAPLFLPGARAHHAAAALGGDDVLLAGGCADMTADGACEPASAIVETRILDVRDGSFRPGPALQQARFGPTAVVQGDGTIVLLGGTDPGGDPLATAERIDVGEGVTTLIDGVGAAGTALIGGGLVAAFAAPGTAGVAEAAVIPPGSDEAVSVAQAPQARAGASMTALEDGSVLIVGGVDGEGAEVVTYEPVLAAFRSVADAPATQRRDHAAVALDDGSVLVLGGVDENGDALADAWIFRPDLTGPFTSDVSVSFGDTALAALVVPSDPARSSIEPAADGVPVHFRLQSSGAGGGLPRQWAVIGGPTFLSVSLSARMRAQGGGAALLVGFVDEAHYTAVVFLPGQAATVFTVADGVVTPVAECEGQVVSAAQLRPDGSAAVEVDLAVQATSIAASIGGVDVLSCSDMEPVPRGYVGFGVVGDAAAALRVDSVLVAR